ncbi:peptide ABC transporter [Rhizobium sp. Leaf306]|uniref:ABC transporter permease n=1 Tax=Rhizobium/Agrobacterium group TaxID=227290 RepID=UPI0007158D20|nr:MULTISPECIES: ABC transporter permease [unclassified Rhizobium]KQQ35163.1 peptide ABC transporter [Rhizobium sp. Leaf306]MBD8649464.1 ABC transporter permease [Rhizobium sp. CFBP 13726]MBD8664743.1 ABC transporter permease [Rhizobium sp. CFBP 8752]
MLSYVLRRLAIAIPTLLLVSILVFSLLKFLPGDPAIALAGEERDPAVIEYLRQKYSLDQPLYVQYGKWLAGIVQGDFGLSIRTRLPIGEMIAQKLPVTIQLSVMAMILATLIGIPAGIIAALKRGTAADYGVSIIGLAGLSVPSFWLGIMLILLFAVTLGWFPSGGYVAFFDSPLDNLRHTLLPSLVLGTAAAAIVMRHTRSAMLQVLKQDYVRTARAKGLKERIVVVRHVLRNSLVPVVTMSTLHLGELLSGAVLTEQVFGIPGFGKMIVDGVFSRDYAVVQAVVLCSAALFLLMNLLADIAYVILSPRLRG